MKTTSMKTIVIFTSVLSLFAYLVMNENYYTIKAELQLEDVTELLLIFSVIALLIERFSNKLVFPKDQDEARTAKKHLSHKKDSALTNNTDAIKQKSIIQTYQKNFLWFSFFISILVAALGFRFFSNIFEFGCNNNSCIHLSSLLDIFLTAILLSGGATLFNSILDILKK